MFIQPNVILDAHKLLFEYVDCRGLIISDSLVHFTAIQLNLNKILDESLSSSNFGIVWMIFVF